MNQEPRRNEDRFYRYPTHRVVGVLDGDAPLDAALRALGEAGVDVDDVHVLSGPEGAALLDRTGVRHGLRARLLRFFQRWAYEMDSLRDHERALNAGRHVVYVAVRNSAEADRVAATLRAGGGHHLLYFRRWSIERPRA